MGAWNEIRYAKVAYCDLEEFFRHVGNGEFCDQFQTVCVLFSVGNLILF